MSDIDMSESFSAWMGRQSASAFQQKVKSRVRSFPPSVFAPALSRVLRQAFDSIHVARRSPPHFILHAIEANCCFYRVHYRKPFSDNDLAKLMNDYHEHYDPVSQYNLQEIERVDLFFLFLYRQQIVLQQWPQKDDVGRSLILFNEAQLPKSVAALRRIRGFGFGEWIRFCLGLWAGLLTRDPPIIGPSFFFNAEREFIPNSLVQGLFEQLASTPEQVGREYDKRRRERGITFDLFLPSQFLERPLLRLGSDHYLAVHPPALLSQAVEGLFDLCRDDGKISVPFQEEFSIAFERYVEGILKAIPNATVYSERDIQRYNGGKKSCDFLVIGDQWMVFVECKATEYSSMLSTEFAISRDNSTKKLARSVEQIVATAEQVASGELIELLHDVGGKQRVAITVTYRPIVGANLDPYWEKIILPQCSAASRGDKVLDFRPQFMGVGDLETFVEVVRSRAVTPVSLVQDRLQSAPHVAGEWETFLRPMAPTGLDPFGLDAQFQSFMSLAKGAMAERREAAK